jgi:hypothetical protein
MFLGADTLLTQDLGATVGNFFCLTLIRVYFKFLTGLGRSVQTEYYSRC